jgi:opacity protein-like surface antigen
LNLPEVTESASTKEKLNFAYSLILGTAIKVSPNVNIEIAYSWKDFGSTSYNKDSDGDRPDKNRYHGHTVMTGIRFDI